MKYFGNGTANLRIEIVRNIPVLHELGTIELAGLTDFGARELKPDHVYPGFALSLGQAVP